MSVNSSTAGTAEPAVAVLLATYDGARFLDAQLRSIAEQTVARIDVWASDDGSSDTTLDILRRWAGRWDKGRFHILNGPRAGFAENFRSLIVNPAIEADYFAYGDQDDLWDADKLRAGVTWLSSTPAMERPSLFCSRTRLVDEQGELLGLSPLFTRPPHFRNALVQSIAGGNTMVVNRSARQLLLEASGRTSFVTHDWWSYLLVTGAGGMVHYELKPQLSYRQHDTNLVGANRGMAAQVQRFGWLAQGRFGNWMEANLAGLELCQDLLDEEARHTLARFRQARQGSALARLAALGRSGVYRQTALGQLALFIGCLTGRL